MDNLDTLSQALWGLATTIVGIPLLIFITYFLFNQSKYEKWEEESKKRREREEENDRINKY